MFAFKSFVVAALPIVAFANPLAIRTDTGACNTGNVQCCQSTQQINNSNPLNAVLAGLLGVPVQDLGALVGLTCTPISLLGVASGTSCDQQTVCCSGNTYNGNLLAVGCSPIKL
ncbi:hypothetical protein CVT24_011522 [Panaeolus cyanescens]|uniref:Hydrophobin n=1 Tax=Panaeolus cyanescens TaxID=181874 RepID=A0A409VMG5_9AGAR|nr:hypothetical protein CVT24_011522 [Panaeolus cyanescens]